MKIDCTWLEQNFFKENLNNKQTKIVCQQFEAVEHKQGEVIISQGEACKTVYIVYSGSANIDCKNNGQNIHVGIVKPGNLVGEMSFISETTASATVTALEDCILFKLSKVAFSQIQKQDKGLVNLTFMNLLKHSAEIIRKMNAEKVVVQRQLSNSHF